MCCLAALHTQAALPLGRRWPPPATYLRVAGLREVSADPRVTAPMRAVTLWAICAIRRAITE